jgi:hypothetical protein
MALFAGSRGQIRVRPGDERPLLRIQTEHPRRVRAAKCARSAASVSRPFINPSEYITFILSWTPGRPVRALCEIGSAPYCFSAFPAGSGTGSDRSRPCRCFRLQALPERLIVRLFRSGGDMIAFSPSCGSSYRSSVRVRYCVQVSTPMPSDEGARLPHFFKSGRWRDGRYRPEPRPPSRPDVRTVHRLCLAVRRTAHRMVFCFSEHLASRRTSAAMRSRP